MESTNSSGLEVALSRMHWPVTALGYGNRVGIWFQGCSIRCRGCCSQDTWQADRSALINVETLLDWISLQVDRGVDGFTLSGGEPFDQPDALLHLVVALRQRYCATGRRDILVYSGYPWRKLIREYPNVLPQLDVVVSGPYVAKRPAVGLRGSDNQEFHLLSELARKRYGPSTGNNSSLPQMQLCYDGDTLWMIGIPRSGDLGRLQEKLNASGIDLEDVSWRA